MLINYFLQNYPNHIVQRDIPLMRCHAQLEHSIVIQVNGHLNTSIKRYTIKTTDYPIELDRHNANRPATNRVLRESSTRVWRENAATKLVKESFCRNAAKLWNNASSEVKEAETLYKAKTAIKKCCLTLQI